MKLMIIESPGKLKKLRPMMKKLRPNEDWQVIASGGHIRDLPVSGQRSAVSGQRSAVSGQRSAVRTIP